MYSKQRIQSLFVLNKLRDLKALKLFKTFLFIFIFYLQRKKKSLN